MIVTVTLNAALDRTVRVPNFQLGARHRADSSLRLPGGKGVNIARALKTLGQPVIATGLAGGRIGTYIIEELTAEGILNDFVRIQDESRTSTAVIDPTNNQQTEINECGPVGAGGRARGAHRQDPLPLEGRRRVRARRVAAARRADRLVRAPAARAAREGMIDRGRRRRVRRCAPPSRPSPGVVSPNVREAEEIVGHEFGDEDDMAAAAVTLAQMGAETALIHHEDGCVARVRTEGGQARAHLPGAPAPRARTWSRPSARATPSWPATSRPATATSPRGKALALAVACGAANTQRFGAGVFDPSDVEALMRRVEVVSEDD